VRPIQLLFWTSLILILYTYAGYPLVLWMYSFGKRLNVQKEKIEPTVSVVMSVLNGEAHIRERLDNILSQDYPAEKIEIIVVSDGSTDKTCEIVRSFKDGNVQLEILEKRQGKALALNHGMTRAKGEIVVFTDTRQRFEPDAVSHLVAGFGDYSVGCVSGELVFVQDNDSTIQTEMGAYWKYEKWIRNMESQTGSVVGATGAIYAIRRDLYRVLPANTLIDDVLTPLNIVRQGFRCTFDRLAVAYDTVSKDAEQEWRRKVRTLAGNWQLLNLHPALFLPWSNPCWWRFISHKILRLILPFALILLFVSGLFFSGVFYRLMTVAQFLFYSISLIGVFVPAARNFRIVNMCYFFLVMNLAAVGGFWIWITGRCATAWQTAGAPIKSG